MLNINKDDLIKSLTDLGISKEEAESMILTEAVEIEKAKVPAEEEKEKEEGEYSEEKEKELEKCMSEAADKLKAYSAKKPKVVEKSEETNIGGFDKEEFQKSFNGMFDDLQKSFESRFDDLQKSLETVSQLEETVATLKEEVNKIAKSTPPAKSFGLTNEAIIEKAVSDGVTQDGKLHMSARTHKTQIGDLLSELCISESGELQKSLEADLGNFISGGNELGAVAKRLLAEKKNVVVH